IQYYGLTKREDVIDILINHGYSITNTDIVYALHYGVILNDLHRFNIVITKNDVYMMINYWIQSNLSKDILKKRLEIMIKLGGKMSDKVFIYLFKKVNDKAIIKLIIETNS